VTKVQYFLSGIITWQKAAKINDLNQVEEKKGIQSVLNVIESGFIEPEQTM
jgi:hypothetical protein